MFARLFTTLVSSRSSCSFLFKFYWSLLHDVLLLQSLLVFVLASVEGLITCEHMCEIATGSCEYDGDPSACREARYPACMQDCEECRAVCKGHGPKCLLKCSECQKFQCYMNEDCLKKCVGEPNS